MIEPNIQDMISDCFDYLDDDYFSGWEKDFIESIENQYTRRGSITDKQELILERIWKKIS